MKQKGQPNNSMRLLVKWNESSQRDQNLILILICATMVGGYIGGVYLASGLHESVFETKKLVSRKENRLTLKKQKLSNINDPGVYENKLTKIQPEFDEIRKKYNALKNGFVPLDDLQKVESLRLEISEHARKSGLAIKTMATIDGRVNNSRSTPNKESRKKLTRNKFKRLLVKVNSYTTFSGLLKFLDGLEQLSYYAPVVQINIEAVIPELGTGESEAPSTKKLINVGMIIAL